MTELADKLEIGHVRTTKTADWDYVQAVRAAWGTQLLPFPDRTYQLVYVEDTLELVSWFHVHDALCDVWRVLKPGGTLEIWTVDLEWLIKCHRESRRGDRGASDKPCWGNPEFDPFLWFNFRLFGAENTVRRSIFNERHLRHMLGRAGFVHIGAAIAPHHSQPQGDPQRIGLIAMRPG